MPTECLYMKPGDEKRGCDVHTIEVNALSRFPTAQEKKLGCEALELFADDWEKQLAAAGKPDRGTAKLRALATYCHAIMNSASFLFVD